MKEKLKTFFELQGNNGANYIQLGRFAGDDNRLFVEIGDCCVVTFRGYITVEAFTNFLTHVSFDYNGLLEAIRDKMAWDEDVNEKFFEGCKELEWHEKPFYP